MVITHSVVRFLDHIAAGFGDKTENSHPRRNSLGGLDGPPAAVVRMFIVPGVLTVPLSC